MRSRLVAGAAALASLVLAGPAGAVAPNNWGAVGSLSVGRSLAVSAVLPDGNVLVAGGTGTAPVASSEIFDPATDAWSAGPDMSNPRAGAVAVTLR